MLVDIPVTISFDCENVGSVARAADSRTFTMRFDTDDGDKPAQWCSHYPSREKEQWITDEQGVLFDLLTSRADKKIKERALASPEDYCADPAEAKVLQEQIDEERRQSGQFGAGA